VRRMGARVRIGWVVLASPLGCARITLHAPNPGVSAARVPVRFETSVDPGQVRVATATPSGTLLRCTLPCTISMPVGHVEVAVQGPVRFVQALQVPPTGGTFVLTDRDRSRRNNRSAWLTGSGVIAGLGLTGTSVGAVILLGEEFSCSISRAIAGGASVPCGGSGGVVTIAFGLVTGMSLVALLVSAIAANPGAPPRLEPAPSLRVDAAPLPGGAAVGVAANF
jgi:hypothetical protein